MELFDYDDHSSLLDDPISSGSDGSEYMPSPNNLTEVSEIEQLEVVNSDPKKRTRKRQAFPELWKKNLRKKLRALGKSYINTKGVVVQPKQFTESKICCSKECFKNISQQTQKNIFQMLYELGSFNKQNNFIFTNVKVDPVARHYATQVESNKTKTNTRRFHLPSGGYEVQVCKSLFIKVLAISNGRIDRVLKGKAMGTPPMDKRGKHVPANKTSDSKIEQVCSFINSFPTYLSHYCRHKSSREYLPPDINIKTLYSEYNKKVQKDNLVSEGLFRETFCKKFNLHFHRPISDSCRTCDSTHVKISHKNDENKKNYLKAELELHHRKAEKVKLQMKQDSIECNDDRTVIAFDLMKTLPTPVLSTGITYYKRQLWTYCLGVHDLQNNTAVMYVWNESVASRGPEEIGSCLTHYFNNYIKTTNVTMYSDACGGQNRNIKLSIFCQYLVQSSNNPVTGIKHNFLVSGHSFLPCDSDFGVIEKNKKMFPNIFVPYDWVQVIKSARKKKPFTVVKMMKEHFISINTYMRTNVTNRKISIENSKVKWLSILSLKHIKDDPFVLYIAYGHDELFHPFQKVNLKKRKNINAYSKLTSTDLPILYSKGLKISPEKKKDLISLLDYIPPIYHLFYHELKNSKTVKNKIDVQDDSEEDD